MVGKWSCNGKIRTCKIHDRLRDACMLIAHGENFLHLVREDEEIGHGGHGGDETQPGLANLFDFANNGEIGHVSAFANDGEIGCHVGDKSQRRLITHISAFACFGRRSTYCMARSLICFGKLSHLLPDFYLGFKLLRVLDIVTDGLYEFPDEICELVFLRYLGLTYDYPLPPSIARLWNLQTIVFYNGRYVRGLPIPVEIWSMLNLRHIYFTAHLLPHPPALHLLRSNPVLENLQTLVGISDLRFTKDILKCMPNLKKLGILYDAPSRVDWSEYQLESLVNLHRLESLKITVKYRLSASAVHPPKLAFPQKLERLTLSGCLIPWESMSVVGALPNLQVLKLRNHACQGEDWEPVEGQFCQLKFLLLEDSDLVQWRCDDIHFPLLKRLILRRCDRLQEVPSGLGEIATLERMELVDCYPSAVESAELIREQQEEMGNEVLKIIIEQTTF